MSDRLYVPNSNDAPFEHFVEELRIKAFRIYESVRTVQRDHADDEHERLRKLSIAGSLAADLSEHVKLATPAVDAAPPLETYRPRSARVSVARAAVR